MKALLLDEEAEGPSDRPMRLVRADDAGAPPPSAGAGSRAAATANVRQQPPSTLMGSPPPSSPKATMGAPTAVPPGFGAVQPAHAGAGPGLANGVSNSGPPLPMSPKPTMGKPAAGTPGFGGVHFTEVNATRNLLNVDHPPYSGSPASPKPTSGKPAGSGSPLGGAHFTQLDATRTLLNSGHPHPTTGTHAGVIPGLGAVHPSHVGATVGLVNAFSHHALAHPNVDPSLHQIAHAARRDPSRWGADLLLHEHNRPHYDELARAGRLPSHVWGHYDGRGRLGEHLREVDARYGEELRWLHRHRPVGERALLGIAAATGVHDAITRALDAMRVHPSYPARASFGRLMYGFEQQDVARIASAFLVRGHEPEYMLEQYRLLRERLEHTHIERRRLLLRRLCAEWAGRGVTLVPMFASVTEGYSPAQIERLRFELARGGQIEATFEAIERANVEARLASSQAAFRRWIAEWQASCRAGAQTPLQEPQTVLLTTVAPSIQYTVSAPQEAPLAPIVVIEREERDSDPGDDAAPDSSPRLVLEDRADTVETPDEEQRAEEPPPADQDEAGYLRVVRAPTPGAHAADGVLPWHYLTQAFRRRDEAELGRAWSEGRAWDAYHALLERTARETTADREAEFCRRVSRLGCELHGPCRLPGDQLGALAHLGVHFAPEQWARLASALMDGTDDPLEVWRAIERENIAEAIAVREPAFLQHLSAWGDVPGRWNPVEWQHGAPRLRRAGFDSETSGLVDELDGALGAEDAAGVGSSDVAAFDGSTFSDEAAGDFGDLGSTLNGLAASAFGSGGAGSDLGGKLGTFARQAVDALHGTTPARGASWGSEASGPIDDVSGAPAVDLGALFGNAAFPGALPLPDLERFVAQWGNNPLGRPITQALLGLGLPDLASAPPSQLLRMIPPLFPPTSTDPNGWWSALTAAQGLDDASQRTLRATIDADGPRGIQHTIAVYQRLLQGPSDELRARREALFTRLLGEAQRIAGPALDPSALPGGDPFALLAQNAGNWRPVYDAIMTGNNPLGAFRRAEAERQNGCFYSDAPARMATMLAALWNARLMAGWGQRTDAGEPGEAGDIRTPGAFSRQLIRREPVREAFRRELRNEPFRYEPRHEPFRYEYERGFFRDYRPRPLYHLSFGRPMSHRELGRILRVVPALQAHPEGVLREMAGLATQAIDVRGVDATTGEYLLARGDTFEDIAYRLVGDRARWRELEAANPMRAEGDVRVRIPPGWFGYVPYAIPRRPNARALLPAVLGGPFAGIGLGIAGLFHRHHHYRFLGPVARRVFGHHYYRRGFGPVAGLFGYRTYRGWDAAGPDDVAGAEIDEAGALHGGGSMHGRRPLHVGGGRRGGFRGGRRAWGGEYRVAFENAPEEDLDESFPDSEFSPETDESSGPLDFLAGLNPFGSGVPAAKVPAQHPQLDMPTFPPPGPDYAGPPEAWKSADFGATQRRNSGPRPNLTSRTYVVKQGDWPVRIAKAFGATARRHWLTELERANPHKPVDDGIGNWYSLSTGETVNVPDAWGAGSVDTGGVDQGEEAAGPDSDWHSLADMESATPYFAPLARYFRIAPDPEGTWRTYGNTLAPPFEIVAPGEARGATLETAAAGFYIALPGASGPAGWRRATTAELRHFKPEALRQLGGLTFWADPAFGIEPVPTDPETGDADAGALTDRENLTRQTYAVLRGEGMYQIARKFGAAARPHWFAELRDANPTKAITVDPTTKKQVGWRTLNPGDIVNLPDAWATVDSPHARPAPGGAPSPAPYLGLQTFPPLPEHGAYPSPTAPPGTTPAAATVDPGTILRVQGILVAFRHAHPADMNPANFGDGLPVSQDCLGVITPRTQQALSSFQIWSNKQGRSPMDERQSLRTDGVLDPATIAALDSFSAQALGGLAQRPPVLIIPGALPPRRGDPAPAGNVLGKAATAIDDFAQGAAAAGGASDQWADMFRGSAPPAAPEVAPRKPGAPAPLHDLPDVLDRNGAPGVPSLPPGAPHGPRGPRRPRAEAPVVTANLQAPLDVDDRANAPGPVPPDAKPTAKARKDDDVILPMALAGLSLFSGII
jgi:hypothetical protein